MNELLNQAKKQVRDAENALYLANKNLKFAQLTPGQRRVAIAKDVIQQIELGKIHPEAGVYIADVKTGDDKTVSCNACALGSLFACAVNKPELKAHVKDFLDVDAEEDISFAVDSTDAREMRRLLEPYFSLSQLELIETAFECGNVTNSSGLSESYLNRAVSFGERYQPEEDEYGDFDEEEAREMDRKRLVAIMKNIIKNNGTFRP